jgi:PHD/YefM family antitoxin component YafN of YafNO toxin-antitoxin module
MTWAISGQPVYITNRDQPPKVVLISTEKYHALVNREKKALERLTGEFDAMLEAMQAEDARSAADSLFTASSEALGRAAVEAAKRKK